MITLNGRSLIWPELGKVLTEKHQIRTLNVSENSINTHYIIQRGQKHDGLCIVIPDHLPKVFYCVRHRVLGHYEVP